MVTHDLIYILDMQDVARAAARAGRAFCPVRPLYDPFQSADPHLPVHHSGARQGVPVQIPGVGLPNVPCRHRLTMRGAHVHPE